MNLRLILITIVYIWNGLEIVICTPCTAYDYY